MKYIDFKIKYTAADLYKYEREYLFRKYLNMFTGIPGLIIVGAFVYFLIIGIQQGIDSVNKLALVVFGVLLAALVLVIFRIIAMRLSYKKRYEGKEILKKETRIVLSLEGEYPDDLGHTPVYDDAIDFMESKDLFIVEVGDSSARRALIIPKRYTETENSKSFVRNCAARMIQNSKPKRKDKNQKKK